MLPVHDGEGSATSSAVITTNLHSLLYISQLRVRERFTTPWPLFKTILTGLGDRDIRLVNTEDLYDLRNFAFDRKKWREMSKI